MPVLILVLQFLNLFSAALVTGGQVAVLLVIMPVKRRLATRTSVEVHNTMLGHQIDSYMKPSGIVSGMTALMLLLIDFRFNFLTMPSLVALILGMLGTLGVVLTSRYGNVPTNAMMATWSLDEIPEDYPEIRARWDRTHTIRAACGALGFAGYATSALLMPYPALPTP